MTIEWNDVDVGFGEDETANFGPRMEAGTALYQVDTTATISPTGQISENPPVVCYSGGDTVCVSAGCHLSLFQDSCRRYLISMAFKSSIDAVTCDDNGLFIVVAESNGCLHLLDILSQQKLFSKTLVSESDLVNGHAFQHIKFTPVDEQGICELLVLTCAGKLLRFRNVHIRDLLQALDEKDHVKAKLAQAEMKMEVLDASKVHTESTRFASVLQNGNILTAGSGVSELALWEKIDDKYIVVDTVESFADTGCVIKDCQLTTDEKLIFVRYDNDRLSVWSVHTLTMVKDWPDIRVQDFRIIESGHRLKEWTAIVLCNTDDKYSLQVCQLPTLDMSYSLDVSAFTYLVKSTPDADSIICVEGVHENDLVRNESDLITTLRIRNLSEALPETRLSRLLSKKQFKEAEEFARLYDQDIELVHSVHANHLLDQLSPWNVGRLTDDEVNRYLIQLRTCLERVNDVNHLVTCSVKGYLPTFTATLDILMYARTRLMKDPEKYAVLLEEVTETLKKLSTFKMCFGEQYYSGSSWERFMSQDLLTEFIHQLSAGNINTALCIWSRHQVEFEDHIKVHSIEKSLSAIPETTPSQQLIPWLLNDFIPYVVRVLPKAVPKLAAWVQQKARNMEIMERDEWPQNSLQFCELLQEAGVVGITKGPEDSKDPLIQIYNLQCHLRELIRLHAKYNCKLSLAEYLQESRESLTYRMLDRVAALELIPQALENFVRPYMREKQLDEDKILYQYIEDLAKTSRKLAGVRYRDSPFEAKALIIIEHILDEEYKLCAILDAIKRVQLPWSSDVEDLIQHALKLEHPKVSDLKKELGLMEIRSVLARYKELESFNVGETEDAKHLLYYIIKQNRDTVDEDMRAVLNTYNHLCHNDAYLFRIRCLVLNNKVDEAVEYWAKLTQESRVIVGQRFVQISVISINRTVHFDKQRQRREQILLTKCACRILKALVNEDSLDDFECREVLHYLDTLPNIHSLQTEYGEHVSYHDYNNDTFRTNLCVKYVQMFFKKEGQIIEVPAVNGDRKSSGKKHLTFPAVYRLGEILKISQDKLEGQLALKAAEVGQLQMALEKSNELYQTSRTAETGEVLYKVAHIMSTIHADDDNEEKWTSVPNLAQQISDLADKALVLVPPELLADCVELCRCSRLALTISRQCESGDYGASVSGLDERSDSLSEGQFREDGLVMDSSVIKPAAYRYTVTSLPEPKCPEIPLQHFRTKTAENTDISDIQTLCGSAQECVQYLNENSHMELAFAYSQETAMVIMQHFALNFNKGRSNSKQTDGEATKEKDTLQQSDQQTLMKLLKICMVTSQNLRDTLIKKMFNQNCVDHDLALSYALQMPKQQAFEKLFIIAKASRKNHKKILAISDVGVDLATLHSDSAQLDTFTKLKTCASWGCKLAGYKIQLKDPFEGLLDDKKDLVEKIASCSEVDLKTLKEYCNDFDLNLDNALMLYLKHILVPPTSMGQTPAPFTPQLQNTASKVTQQIYCTDFLLDQLNEFVNKIGMYDYDRLEFVLNEIEKIQSSSVSDMGLKLVKRLALYKRKAPPTEFEMTYQCSASGNQAMLYVGGDMDPLAKERVPFHPLLNTSDAWKIITPELSENTVESWLETASILGLPVEKVLITTVHSIVKQHVSRKKQESSRSQHKQSPPGGWCLNERVNTRMFGKIVKLLLRVKHCELAVACCGWIVKELPLGREKIEALKQCVGFARKWIEVCPEKSEEREKAMAAYGTFQQLYKKLSVEEVLVRNNLIEYKDLINNPTQLLISLYEHDCILRQGDISYSGHMPDIHKMCRTIAKIEGLDNNKIRLFLVQKWLPSCRRQSSEANETMDSSSLNITVSSQEGEDGDKNTLKRVVYLLQDDSVEKSAAFLLDYAYQTGESSITNACRYRALQCLTSLLDDETREKVTKGLPGPIKRQMQTLKYLSILDKLHIPQTVNSFQKCNKEGLVKGIWRNHHHDKKAVRLVSDLCLDFDVYDPQLWNCILQQLITFHMREYLELVLLRLSGKPELWQVGCHQKAWQSLVVQPLANSVCPLDEEQEAECIKAVQLLFRCPIIQDLDLTNISKQLMRLELWCCAAGTMITIPIATTRDQIQTSLLRDTDNCCMVLDQIEEWCKQRRVLALADQVEDLVLNHLVQQKAYKTVLGWKKHISKFTKYAVLHGALNDLVTYDVKHDRLSSAIQHVELYTKLCSESEFPQSVSNEDLTPKQVFWRYLDNEDLSSTLDKWLPERPEDPTAMEENMQ